MSAVGILSPILMPWYVDGCSLWRCVVSVCGNNALRPSQIELANQKHWWSIKRYLGASSCTTRNTTASLAMEGRGSLNVRERSLWHVWNGSRSWRSETSEETMTRSCAGTWEEEAVEIWEDDTSGER